MNTPDPVGANSARQAPDEIADPRSKAGASSGESLSSSRAEAPREAFAALIPEIRLLVGLTTAAVVIVALYFGREILIPLALARCGGTAWPGLGKCTAYPRPGQAGLP